MPKVDEPKTTQLNVRLADPQRVMLEERARELGWNVSELMRHVVACYFEARGK